ncbi:LINE-1 reverse transcriptase homolog [Linum perenne]
MAGDKAPGPDGFNAFFYKNSWSVTGDEVVETVRYFMEKGVMPSAVNSVILALIPKKTQAAEMKDFRLISWCNVLYKIVSKVLANRLSVVLPDLISNAQTAFVKGRKIGDGILMAHELLKNYKKSGVSPRCAMKVDLMKAFDSVEWKFVLNTLRAMQVPQQFVSWIEVCFQSTMLSININGTLKGYFPARRGLRQGDPISPYLFVIFMEVLSCLFHRAIKSRSFQFHPQCKAVGLSHLSFADDLLIFTKANEEAIKGVTEILREFHSYSGLQFNPDKSTIYMAGIQGVEAERLVRISGFVEENLPFKYLGMPLTAGKLRRCDCKALVDKITRRVTDWKARKLSYAGKVQLIDTVLGGTLQYWMSNFVLPSSLIKEVEKICSSFLWGFEVGQGKAKVAWNIVAMPKAEGGLGVKDFRSWNSANIIRHIWAILSQAGSLWIAWLNAYRLKGRSFWLVRSTSGSWHWKRLLKLREVIRSYVSNDEDGDLLWNGKIMSKFKLAEVWEVIRVKGNAVSWYSLIWTGFVIPRRSITAWIILNDRVATRDKIKKWNPGIDTSCELCQNAEETRDHIFTECVFAVHLMQQLLPELVGLNWEGMLAVAVGWRLDSVVNRTKRLIWRVLISTIWIERCRRVFTRNSLDVVEIGRLIREEILIYAQGHREGSSIAGYL